ncbi:MAG: aminopeptidase [Marinoscillum sp.]
MWKKILLGILLILMVFSIWNWHWVTYGYFQARGQLKVILDARPIQEFIEDPNFPDSLKDKLRLTQVVRRYAIDSLGLHQSENYTKLYDQEGKTLLWNVSASEPYELKAYRWKFPILGSMPYKGFFDLEKAKVEAEQLKAQGYDVRIRTVGGWSTLGILEDPLLSNMLERNEGSLAEVIIHELTHATIFIKNEIEFNENLASFIGERGAELFLTSHFGDSSNQHMEYLQSERDSRTLTQIILKGAKRLDSLYTSFSENDSMALKDSLKSQLIREITVNLDTTEFYNPRYREIFATTQPNNAYFMAFRRYHDQEDSIQSIYSSYNRNFKLMISDLKSKYGK